jgi:hypothetical protein
VLLVQLIEEIVALAQGVLSHFVTGDAGVMVLKSDYEWSLSGFTPFTLSTKGEYLSGAVADIVTYGAILVDWIVQAMLNQPVNAETALP